MIYHDTAGDYRDDYLTRFDFDGDWDATNNKASLDSELYPLVASVYYSVIETETHWFLTYAFFHPYDASLLKPSPEPAFCLLHENDMEGVILTVRKDGSPFGELRAMATEAHGEVYYFKPDGSDVGIGSAYYDNAGSSPDTTAYFVGPSGQLAVFIEADGHGVGSRFRALTPSSPGIVTLGGVEHDFQNGDGVIYYHDGGAPEEPAGDPVESVRYELRPLEELWSRRHNTNGELPYCDFANFVGSRGCTLENLAISFRGSCYFGTTGCAANPPWGWDSDAPGSPVGEWFLDPAYAAGFLHLQDLPERTAPGFAAYSSNPYLQGDTHLDLLTPTEGAEWSPGSEVSIQWGYEDTGQGPAFAGTVDVEISRDGGPPETIASRVPIADGEVSWIVSGPEAECRLRITAPTDCVLSVSDEAAVSIVSTVSIPDWEGPIHVRPAWPNPFRESVAVEFALGVTSPVRLSFHDITGRLVRTLLAGRPLPPSTYFYSWDGRNDLGQAVPPGAYLYRLQVGEKVYGGKVVRVQ